MTESNDKNQESAGLKNPEAIKVDPREGQSTLESSRMIKAEEDWTIKFVGKRKLSNGETVDLEAPSKWEDGMNSYKLPSSEQQKAGFKFDRAAELARVFPEMYKVNKIK